VAEAEMPNLRDAISAALFEAKCASSAIRRKSRSPSCRRAVASDLGPFKVEFIPVAHSIPESTPLADPHFSRNRAAHGRLEDRSDADHRSAERTSGGCANSVTPACWR